MSMPTEPQDRPGKVDDLEDYPHKSGSRQRRAGLRPRLQVARVLHFTRLPVRPKEHHLRRAAFRAHRDRVGHPRHQAVDLVPPVLIRTYFGPLVPEAGRLAVRWADPDAGDGLLGVRRRLTFLVPGSP